MPEAVLRENHSTQHALLCQKRGHVVLFRQTFAAAAGQREEHTVDLQLFVLSHRALDQYKGHFFFLQI